MAIANSRTYSIAFNAFLFEEKTSGHIILCFIYILLGFQEDMFPFSRFSLSNSRKASHKLVHSGIHMALVDERPVRSGDVSNLPQILVIEMFLFMQEFVRYIIINL